MNIKSIDTKIFTILINLILVFPSVATNFNSALEGSEQDVVAIRNAVISTAHPILIDNSLINGKVVTVLSQKTGLSSELKSIPAEFIGITGQLPKGIIDWLTPQKDLYLRNIAHAANANIRATEFVFSGSGEGGRISSILAGLWAKEYERIAGVKPGANQIKVITFSASAFGDAEFNRSFTNLLGQRNIIDFTSYFSHPTLCGVPIFILPDEQLFSAFSSLKNVSFGSILKTGVTIGFLFYSYSKLNDLNITSHGYINASSVLVEEHANLKDHNYINYTLSLNRFTDALNTVKYMILAYQAYFLLSGAYNSYYDYYFIPSESILRESFRYTQGNYRTSTQASLEAIGKPPIISMRRGIGKMIRYLMGL